MKTITFVSSGSARCRETAQVEPPLQLSPYPSGELLVRRVRAVPCPSDDLAPRVLQPLLTQLLQPHLVLEVFDASVRLAHRVVRRQVEVDAADEPIGIEHIDLQLRHGQMQLHEAAAYDRFQCCLRPRISVPDRDNGVAYAGPRPLMAKHGA